MDISHDQRGLVELGGQHDAPAVSSQDQLPPRAAPTAATAHPLASRRGTGADVEVDITGQIDRTGGLLGLINDMEPPALYPGSGGSGAPRSEGEGRGVPPSEGARSREASGERSNVSGQSGLSEEIRRKSHVQIEEDDIMEQLRREELDSPGPSPALMEAQKNKEKNALLNQAAMQLQRRRVTFGSEKKGEALPREGGGPPPSGSKSSVRGGGSSRAGKGNVGGASLQRGQQGVVDIENHAHNNSVDSWNSVDSVEEDRIRNSEASPCMLAHQRGYHSVAGFGNIDVDEEEDLGGSDSDDDNLVIACGGADAVLAGLAARPQTIVPSDAARRMSKTPRSAGGRGLHSSGKRGRVPGESEDFGGGGVAIDAGAGGAPQEEGSFLDESFGQHQREQAGGSSSSNWKNFAKRQRVDHLARFSALTPASRGGASHQNVIEANTSGEILGGLVPSSGGGGLFGSASQHVLQSGQPPSSGAFSAALPRGGVILDSSGGKHLIRGGDSAAQNHVIRAGTPAPPLGLADPWSSAQKSELRPPQGVIFDHDVQKSGELQQGHGRAPREEHRADFLPGGLSLEQHVDVSFGPAQPGTADAFVPPPEHDHFQHPPGAVSAPSGGQNPDSRRVPYHDGGAHALGGELHHDHAPPPQTPVSHHRWSGCGTLASQIIRDAEHDHAVVSSQQVQSPNLSVDSGGVPRSGIGSRATMNTPVGPHDMVQDLAPQQGEPLAPRPRALDEQLRDAADGDPELQKHHLGASSQQVFGDGRGIDRAASANHLSQQQQWLDSGVAALDEEPLPPRPVPFDEPRGPRAFGQDMMEEQRRGPGDGSQRPGAQEPLSSVRRGPNPASIPPLTSTAAAGYVPTFGRREPQWRPRPGGLPDGAPPVTRAPGAPAPAAAVPTAASSSNNDLLDLAFTKFLQSYGQDLNEKDARADAVLQNIAAAREDPEHFHALRDAFANSWRRTGGLKRGGALRGKVEDGGGQHHDEGHLHSAKVKTDYVGLSGEVDVVVGAVRLVH